MYRCLRPSIVRGLERSARDLLRCRRDDTGVMNDDSLLEGWQQDPDDATLERWVEEGVWTRHTRSRACASAFGVLREWMGAHDVTCLGPRLEDWHTEMVHDAVLFANAVRRSHDVFLVRGSNVEAFSPAHVTRESAYARLAALG